MTCDSSNTYKNCQEMSLVCISQDHLSFSLWAGEISGQGERIHSSQLPVAAYVCRPCMWGFVPEQERERWPQFSTYEIIIQRFRETRAPYHGSFSTLQKQGSSGLGSGPQTGGVYQESPFLLLYPCCSCFGFDPKTDHGGVSCAFMVPDSQGGARLSTPSRALFCGSP